jgi:hypothetical protein
MIAPAMIYETSYDFQVQTSYAMEMNLDKIYFDGSDNSKVGLKLRVEESDAIGIMKLSLLTVDGMLNISLPFEFMEQTFQVYLNYNPSLVTAATLTEFSLIPKFFAI